VYFSKNKIEEKAISDPVLKKIKDSGQLLVGVDFSYGVMEFFDENNLPAGIDIDIVTEIARRLGVKVVIKQYDWDALFLAVKNGEIDLAISSITITQERAQEMLFSVPYFNGGQVVLVRADNSVINSQNDLMGKKVGVQKNTTSYDVAIKLTDPSLVTLYDSWENDILPGGIIADLKDEKTEVVLADYIQAVDSVKDPSLKIVGEPFTQEYYGIATKLERVTLIKEVDIILREMKRDGTLENIKNKWTNN
jgi:polar amino acid transport system substrate-binding protein